MSETREPITDYLAYLLANAHRNLHLQLEQQLKAEGVQVEHWRVLEILRDQRGRSMGELAGLVLMNHPALTKLVDRMVADGLVHRVPSPDDLRRVLVFITDRGMDLLERLKPRADGHNANIARRLGKRDAASLKRLLTSLIEETGPDGLRR